MNRLKGIICFIRGNHKISLYSRKCVRCGYTVKEENNYKEM